LSPFILEIGLELRSASDHNERIEETNRLEVCWILAPETKVRWRGLYRGEGSVILE